MTSPKPVSPYRLTSLLRLQKNPTLALQLFQNPNPKNPKTPFRHTLKSYDLIITKLGRAKMFSQMDTILQTLKQESRFTIPEALFCDVISYYGRARLAGRAHKVFDEIPEYNCERTLKSVNSLLKVLLDCREFDKVKEVLAGIGCFGGPDVCTYNVLIHGCCMYGCLDDGLRLFDEMRERGFMPSVVTFGILVYGFCKELRLDEAVGIKEVIWRVYGVRPNAHVYASLISGFCKVGDSKRAFEFKDEMVRMKVECDTSVFNALISGLFRAGRKGEVRKVLKEMKEKGCKPDTVTFNVLIDGYCKEGDIEKALKSLDEMVEDGCKPDIISNNVIVRGLCKEGRWSEAINFFEDMPRRGCSPDVVTYRLLFDGLSAGMQLKEAADILDEMVFKGYVPRCKSVNKFVDRLRLADNQELLWTVINNLAKGNAVNSETWNVLVPAICSKEKLICVSQLIDSLIMETEIMSM